MSATGTVAVVGAAALLLYARRAKAGDLESQARASALRYGANTRILLAICDTEAGGPGRWNQGAVNDTGGDAKRGGAYGVPQMTYLTGRDVAGRHPELMAQWQELTTQLTPPDFTGPPRDLDPLALLDPELCFGLAAAYVAELQSRAGNPSAPDYPEQVASRYNSGRPPGGAPESTRMKYLPAFRRWYDARSGIGA